MEDKLEIILNKKTNRDEYAARFFIELYGDIIIKHNGNIIFKIENDLTDFIEAFVKNKERLRTEKFTIPYTRSLKESEEVIWDGVSDDDDDQIEKWANIFDSYYPYHNFYLGFTKTPGFIIGLNPSGVGEISWNTNWRDSRTGVVSYEYYNYIEKADGSFHEFKYTAADPDYYKYEFDMEAFIKQFDEAIPPFLEACIVRNSKEREFFEDCLGDYAKFLTLTGEALAGVGY